MSEADPDHRRHTAVPAPAGTAGSVGKVLSAAAAKRIKARLALRCRCTASGETDGHRGALAYGTVRSASSTPRVVFKPEAVLQIDAGEIATGSRLAWWWLVLRGVARTSRVRSSRICESDNAPTSASTVSRALSQCS